MKKIFFIFSSIAFISFTDYKEPNFSLKILNCNIKDGNLVVFELKNNTNYDYCFAMDTLFPNRVFYHYYPNLFYNPYVVLYDNKNKQIFEVIRDKSIPELSDNKFVIPVGKSANDEIVRTNYDNFNLIMVKSQSAIRLEIPFKLINRLDNESFSYYKLEKRVNYKAKINYLVRQEFLEKRISRKKIDSIQKKGYKFFIGKLVSNKVPVVVNADLYNDRVKKYINQ